MQEGDDAGVSAGSSRSASPMEVDEGTLPQLNSSRGVEEHRVDPALRQALDKLDALRNHQPTVDDFALENFFERRQQSQPRRQRPEPAPVDVGAQTSSASGP